MVHRTKTTGAFLVSAHPTDQAALLLEVSDYLRQRKGKEQVGNMKFREKEGNS